MDCIGIANVALIIVVGLGVIWARPYLITMNEEFGNIDAMTRRKDELSEQARKRAHAEQTRRRQATHEDIENVLRELRLVTSETKRIEAQISVLASLNRNLLAMQTLLS
jgi:hypothetical protein